MDRKECNEIIDDALKAGSSAGAETEKRMNGRDACGFAWVKIKPARGPLIEALKDRGIGRRDEYAGGYVVSSNQIYQTPQQGMTLREDACQAFADVLKDAGFTAWMTSRID